MASVQLYVYDLSNGIARQLSRQLVGRQIDGIWHTSVAVFGKEVFYGQGIHITQPGRSHHGQPLQIIDMGETALDEGTFNEYLEEMKTHYTADKYHLLDFNCNSFTDDCIGFLTGQSIPSFVKDLPNDFLSTPFGAALRPTIDAMFRGPSPGAATPPAAVSAAQDPRLAAPILQSIASQAYAQPGPSTQATNSLTGPLHIITNTASFNHFLKSHRAAVALFTAPQTCPPCRVIDPVFDRLAEEKGIREGRSGAAFAKIDINVGNGRSLAAEWGIRATPTFMFFLDGKKTEELKGTDVNELRTQVDLLLFQAFPPHPHMSLSLPAIEAMSLNSILFTQVPALGTVLTKQVSFLEEYSEWPNTTYSKDQVKNTILEVVTTYLKPRFGTSNANANAPSAKVEILEAWLRATAAMAATLPVESLFPVADLWRLAILDPNVCSWIVSHPPSNSNGPLEVLLPKALLALDGSFKGARNFSLIMLRLLCNSLSHTALANRLLRTETRDQLTAVLVASLLHPDATVRTTSASLAFNAAAVLQRERVEAVKSGRGVQLGSEEDLGDWQVEVITAVVEALNRENENEEVVHRLAASLAFFLRLSPHYETQIIPLFELLQTRQILKGKLKGTGWHKAGGLAKKDIRRLVEEVADKLC